MLSLEEAITADQVTARGFLRDVDLAPGLTAPVPVGVAEVDGHRTSVLTASATAGPALTAAPVLAGRARRDEGLPLGGIRVLDLGVIVVGVSRRVADQPEEDDLGLRGRAPQRALHRHRPAVRGGPCAGAPAGRAGRRGAVELQTRSLGMDFASLRAVNPGMVVVESSAFGPTGPWAKSLGYGPLVRAKAGFTDQWVHPDEPGSFCDTVIISLSAARLKCSSSATATKCFQPGEVDLHGPRPAGRS